MKLVAVVCLSFLSLIVGNVSCLRVVVAGYNSKLVVFDVIGDSLVQSLEWEVGAQGKDMTWLQLDGDTIWAGHEVGEYEGVGNSVVSRWQVGDTLERMGYLGTGSVYTAHLLVDKEQGRAYAANYGGSTFSVLKLKDDGNLGYVESVFGYGEGCRDASHPHQTVSKDDWVWVIDLGCDMVWHYMVTDSGLEQTDQTSIRAGAGPRHAVFHPTKDLMFLLCELQSYVQVYRYRWVWLDALHDSL